MHLRALDEYLPISPDEVMQEVLGRLSSGGADHRRVDSGQRRSPVGYSRTKLHQRVIPNFCRDLGKSL